MRFMLDTNICIYVINKRPPELQHYFNRYITELCISSVSLAELLYGAEKSAKKAHNRKQVGDFSQHIEILDFDAMASAQYGEIRADLEKKGKSIGANDLLIAAHAKSEGLTLVTNNIKEFKQVKGLKAVNWAAADNT